MRVGKQYLGVPYKKMNCSEFTSKVYARATGVYMPADYIAQRSYGRIPSHRKRGDLLLFKDHVGIYAGHGRILHSSSYFHEVVISDLFYIDGYIGLRRIR